MVSLLMIEVAHAGKRHGNTGSISRRNHVIILDRSAGLDHRGCAGLDQGLSIVPASLAKGLELDDVIVVEPTAIVADDAQGLRLLYVTLTRSTRSLTVVHAVALPDAML